MCHKNFGMMISTRFSHQITIVVIAWFIIGWNVSVSALPFGEKQGLFGICKPTDLTGVIAIRGGADAVINRTDYNITSADIKILEEELKRCNGEIIDPHLHISQWFTNGKELADGLAESNITYGILYNPYPKIELPFDMNEYVYSIASSSGGKVLCLASLNTTHDNWEEHRDFELERLRTYLGKDGVLGAKLAPPHTCLPLNSPIIDDVVETLHNSDKKLLAIHIGTTPFCGPLGKQFGVKCLCTEEYVNPRLIERHIRNYPDVTFALLHCGHEFLPSDSPCYYDFKYADECIAMAKQYSNVYVSMSALFAQHPDGTLKYPGGAQLVKRMKDAGIAHKVFWGSDAAARKAEIRPVLITAIKAMIDAGFTEEERTWSLNGCTRKVFGLPKQST